MAVRALQVFVRSVEYEIRAAIMVESPDGPSVWIVARLALEPERALVNVIARMAGVTGAVFVLKGVSRMTRFAGDHCVESKQGKRSQTMVKCNSARKGFLVVTFVAIRPQLLAMYVVTLVAGNAAGIHLSKLG